MAQPDNLGINSGASSRWNWKTNYIQGLADGQDGLERFSQLSATPDTTALFAGPARFTGVAAGGVALLRPIGMTDGMTWQQDVSLQRLYEIGSNRAFFTRGKTFNGLSFQRLLADQGNIISTLLSNAYPENLAVNDEGTSQAGTDGRDSTTILNLDSEYTNIPFGLMLLFKTKGSYGSDSSRGKVLACVYLEYCMFQNMAFSVANASPVITEGVTLQFDRAVPVRLN